jgi:hypothetical protein
LVIETVPFFEKIRRDCKDQEDFNRILDKFHIEIKGRESELFKFLETNYDKGIYKGFIFFRLK